jgi:putative transposase
MRYAEANPLRAKMVEKAQAWPWSSFGGGAAKDGTKVQLERCPVDKPSDWAAVVNEPIDPPVVARMHLSVTRGQPYGTERWTKKIARRSTLQDPWRPKKKGKKSKKVRKTTRPGLSK